MNNMKHTIDVINKTSNDLDHIKKETLEEIMAESIDEDVENVILKRVSELDI